DDGEADEEADGEGEDGEDGDEAEDGEGEAEGEAAEAASQTQAREQEQRGGRVPSGKLREEAEKRRQAEARVAELEARLAGTTGDNPKIAALEGKRSSAAPLIAA
ncbi:hypothetical protein, partial [Pseudomonas sp. EA_65y_Pfl1_P113]|uniref:hypothetical protein n=1 Tax=Pseudomonas sp. EA_65y_Pfl1_P113 TaxID=3088692 RepID=UPI0030DBF073